MGSIERTDGGIVVRGITGLPDGTTIPYDYNPQYDPQTSQQIKDIVMKILDYVSKEDAMVNRGYIPQYGQQVSGDTPVRARTTKAKMIDYLVGGYDEWDGKGGGLPTLWYLEDTDASNVWMDKPQPVGMFKRGQRYVQNKSKPRYIRCKPSKTTYRVKPKTKKRKK